VAKAGARRRLRAARALHFMRPQLCKSGKRECCGAQVLLQASFSQTTHANIATYCNEPVPTILWREGLFDGRWKKKSAHVQTFEQARAWHGDKRPFSHRRAAPATKPQED